MKKLKTYLLCILIICLYTELNGQGLIAVHHNGTVNYFTDTQTAYDSAQAGDTILLPSGTFSFPTISKELHIYGVGHNPDSTIGTNGFTKIYNTMSYISGSDNSSVVGIYCNNIILGSSGIDTMFNFKIRRCNINQISIMGSSRNLSVIESVIRSCVQGTSNPTMLDSEFALFQNNVFYTCYQSNGQSYGILYFINSIYINNIFTGFFDGEGTYENNIFLYDYVFSPTWPTGTYLNNLFVALNPPMNSSILINNIFGQPLTTIFVNYTSGSINFYQSDFHLQASSPGNNAGTDGTDVGIFGGDFPFKWNTIPENPRVVNSQIGGVTNNEGKLPVQITVEAQDK
jgi:hypothetical protein